MRNNIGLPDRATVPPNNFPLGQPHTPLYAKQACFCGIVEYFQSYFVPTAELRRAGISVAAGCSGPDSKRVTVQFEFSDSRPATTGPKNTRYTSHGFFKIVYCDHLLRKSIVHLE